MSLAPPAKILINSFCAEHLREQRDHKRKRAPTKDPNRNSKREGGAANSNYRHTNYVIVMGKIKISKFFPAGAGETYVERCVSFSRRRSRDCLVS